jgi:hypothetical protein
VVSTDSAFGMAYVASRRDPSEEPEESEEIMEFEEEMTSVSVPTLPGDAQAASHPNVKHITDTLVRMDYLDDLQQGIFLLRDPLENELMRKRNNR